MSFILNLLRKPEKLALPARVIHWIKQAPTFALLDTDEQALEVAHSLDAIVQGREHIQATILLIRDRIAQDEHRVIELETLLASTSSHVLSREQEEDVSRQSSTPVPPSTRDRIVDKARDAYVSTAVEPIRPRPGSEANGHKDKIKLFADLGEELTKAARSI